MWSNINATIEAAKKSSHVKDNGTFIVVLYPQREVYSYYINETWAQKHGAREPFVVVARYKKRGPLLGWAKQDSQQAEVKLKSQGGY